MTIHSDIALPQVKVLNSTMAYREAGDSEAQLPFTHRQIGSGLLGTQEPSGHHGNNGHSGVLSHAGSSAPTCQPRPTSQSSGDHGAVSDLGQISGVGPLPSGGGSVKAHSARVGGRPRSADILTVVEAPTQES
jgi:hypothetical protein